MKTPLDMMLEKVCWVAVNPDMPRDETLPYATHEGILHIEEFSIRVYQLNTGQRVISADDLAAFFGGLDE